VAGQAELPAQNFRAGSETRPSRVNLFLLKILMYLPAESKDFCFQPTELRAHFENLQPTRPACH